MSKPQQLILDVGLRESANFAEFFAGSNHILVRYLEALGESVSDLQVVFWGGRGTGKSHLLQAICHQAMKRQQTAVYLPLKQFARGEPDVLMGMEATEIVCLDDVDSVLGNRHWDLMIFNLINAMRDQNHILVMSASKNFQQFETSLHDLNSRLLWGALFHLEPLNEPEKQAALRTRAKERGFELNEDVIQFLMKHFAEDFGDMLEILGRLDEASLSQQRRITLAFVRDVLGQR